MLDTSIVSFQGTHNTFNGSDLTKRSLSEAAAIPSTQIVTSVRSDPALLACSYNPLYSGVTSYPCLFYVLQFHRDRMLAAAKEFQWEPACRALDGSEGLARLDGALHSHLKDHYGSKEYSAPLKVHQAFTNH